jgi:DNA-binding beta-propeller fold protein YncE
MRKLLFAILVATLALAPRPGRAAEPAFVANQATNDVSVVDLQTATVAFTWSTNSNPRAIAIAPNDLSLYVAAGNDVTVVDVLRPLLRVRLDVTLPFIEATGVAVTLDGSKLFVTHRTNILANLTAAVTMITPGPHGRGLSRDHTDPRSLGAGEVVCRCRYESRHVAEPWDGSVW